MEKSCNGSAYPNYYTTIKGVPCLVEIRAENVCSVDISAGKACIKPGQHDLLCRIVMLLDEKMARNNCIRLGNEYLIYPDKLEIINTEAFAIGDKVRSLCGNGQSTFIVRGYEPRDNRVIVESLNTPSDRVRYAYKITELEKVPDGYKFERGKKYKINGNFTVLCCEPGLNSLGFVQIEGPNIGRFYECAHRAMFITDGGLSELGFHNIQPIK